MSSKTRETAPDETVKDSELKLAIPLLEVVASSPAIVSVVVEPEVSIPSPPTALNAWSFAVTVPLSVVIVGSP